jgi:hypothetical protein
MKRLLVVIAVVLAAGCAASGGGGGDTGIQGVVLAGPQCPVITEASPCPDVPLEADVVATDERGYVVARARSDARGRFRMVTPAGTYTVHVEGLPGIQFAKPVSVTVSDGRFASVTVSVDTGIR